MYHIHMSRGFQTQPDLSCEPLGSSQVEPGSRKPLKFWVSQHCCAVVALCLKGPLDRKSSYKAESVAVFLFIVDTSSFLQLLLFFIALVIYFPPSVTVSPCDLFCLFSIL